MSVGGVSSLTNCKPYVRQREFRVLIQLAIVHLWEGCLHRRHSIKSLLCQFRSCSIIGKKLIFCDGQTNRIFILFTVTSIFVSFHSPPPLYKKANGVRSASYDLFFKATHPYCTEPVVRFQASYFLPFCHSTLGVRTADW